MRIVCRPLLDWPGRMRSDRERDPGNRFRAGWSDTTALLEREAEMIGGRDIVIQLAVPESDIRLDGWPYARAKPSHPGVTIVVPDTKHGRLSWSTDRYRDWRHNVRAIALSMEALRAADRHGIMQGRQYAGFRELAAGDTGGLMAVEDAVRFIAEHSDHDEGDLWFSPENLAQCLPDPTSVQTAYRVAAKRLHPDAGGDPELFRRLREAKQLLDARSAE